MKTSRGSLCNRRNLYERYVWKTSSSSSQWILNKVKSQLERKIKEKIVKDVRNTSRTLESAFKQGDNMISLTFQKYSFSDSSLKKVTKSPTNQKRMCGFQKIDYLKSPNLSIYHDNEKRSKPSTLSFRNQTTSTKFRPQFS